MMRADGSSRGRRPARFGRIRMIAIASALTLLAVGTVSTVASDAAWATDYPSWNDVANARKSEAATKAKIAQIQGLIASLQSDVTRTQADAQVKGDLYNQADEKYQEAALKADELKKQADAAAALAQASITRAGEMIAQLYRAGNGNVSANLLVNAANADNLLYSYGMADKFTEQTSSIYDKALRDQKSAQALTDQANVAKEIRDKAKQEAEAAFAIAQKAADAAAAALEEQQKYQNQLQAELVVLSQRRAATEADYIAGVRARIAAGAQLGAGEISATGWARPAGGPITSGFGWRLDPFGSGGRFFHHGTDLGSGCNAPIYAAHTGHVVYAGWNGVYGNFIRIENPDGVQTEYGHIVNGGTLVRDGQEVAVGMQIARVGSTGGSTGCHLHYGVRIHGVVTDPVAFMRGQGITLG